ncbi:MAG: hypothetical protein Pars2KO_32510 [Parasphingorhabdus sp.]
MKTRSTTVIRILNAAREQFNAKGYAATSLTEIAASLGMSQGNLTYHFPTKRHLAMQLEADVLFLMKTRRESLMPRSLAQDYVGHLLFGMELTWSNRFLMRDHLQYASNPIGQRPDSELTADFDELTGLLKRIQDKDLFDDGAEQDIDVLTRSLWIVSRYWIDYLRELEGLDEISWADQERGIQHHFAVLLPNLKPSTRSKFKAALNRASSHHVSVALKPHEANFRDKLSHAALGPLLPKN